MRVQFYGERFMSCWPPCSGWCECVDGVCRPMARKPNAIRIRSSDGRFLRAVHGPTAVLGLLGPSSQPPSSWDTFLLDAPGTWPVRSGDAVVMRAVDATWRPLPDVLVRVDVGVLRIPPASRKDDPIVTYQFGGPGRSVLVSSPLTPGFPAYTGDDPKEWTFTITGRRADGGPVEPGTPIASGDPVTLSFATRDPARPERFWRLRDDTGPGRVDGDAAPGGPEPDVFVVEFSQVLPDLGWRPPTDGPCRECAGVTAVVTRRGAGTPVADAAVTALPPSVPFAGRTPAAPSDGRAGLSAFVDGAVRTCVPAGPITLQAVADRFQIATVPARVPVQGTLDVPVVMDCTLVTGTVVDSAGSPMPGEAVYLTDRLGVPLLDPDGVPYQTRTGLDGTFRFACVPHGDARVSTDRDPEADRDVTVGPAGVHVDLIVHLTAATVVVRVVDADDGDRPLDGAAVRLTPSSTVARTATTSGSPPQAAFAAVRPDGPATVRGALAGYVASTVTTTIPSAGTLTVTVRLHRDGVVLESPAAFVLQLDWGRAPRDLDLHCSGPDGTPAPAGRFHCFFGALTPVPFVALDVDDTDATGPERIRIAPVGGAFVAGEYHCWIHDYSGESTFVGSGASLALVSLDANGVPTSRGRWVVADVPGDAARLWNVVRFDLDTAGRLTVTPVMAYQPGDWTTLP